MGRKTTEQFKKEVYDLVGDEYTILGEYINNGTKIKVRHNKCEHEYDVTPGNFIFNGRRCPYCYGNMKKTTEQFKKEVYDLVGNEYEVLGEYKNAVSKILMKHNTCGNEYLITPSNFLVGERCPKCNISRIRQYDKNDKTLLFKEKVKVIVGNEYKVLGDYKGSATKILIKHNKCGHEYEVTPNNFLKGARCPHCINIVKKENGRTNWNDNLFKEKVKELVGTEYTILGNYINMNAKIKIKHNNCGYEYETVPNKFLGKKSLNYSNGQRCPKCAYKNLKSRYKDIDV